MTTSFTAEFTNALPLVGRFVDALPGDNYTTIPKDWQVAVTDVVGSRKAIAAGRYKAVNMAGVSMISAIMNALGHQDLPFIFGGDGAAVAFAPEDKNRVRDALSATAGWVSDELELELRAAIVPVSRLLEDGLALKVAAVRVSSAMRNFAFIGGGIDRAEKLMKAGEYTISRAGADKRPDLTGLSCRWTPIGQDGHKIVSLIVEPPEGRARIGPQAVNRLMQLIHADEENASPMPENGPGFTWPPEGLALEAKASGMSKAVLYAITLLAWVLDKTGWPLGKFKPERYRKFTALNTDYRKIQDGIRMTICMPQQEISALRTMLENERNKGELRFGMVEQDEAVLTCFVPSIIEDNHIHFLDGAGGGYAAAADALGS